ncbi:MAG: hypothetical protein KC933_04045 [Myxococcales bacterium]|nr:hypothetical protein [Myxococcales bacterium]MCB9647202.1 hypothetical protein [Deltaproteobacteria bacterium]
MKRIFFAATFTLLLGSACSTSMTSLQTARTMRPGQVQLTAGASVPISSAAVGETIDAAEAIAGRLSDAEARDAPITEAEQRQALETSLALLLFTPGVTTELAGRVGVVDGLDLGFKWAGPLLQVDGKYQLLRQAEHGVDLAVQGSYGYHLGYGASVASSIYPVLDFVQLGDYSQHDLGAGVLLSGEWDDIFGAYLAVRYVASLTSLDADIERVEVATGLAHTEISNTIHHVGGTAGLMVGYKYIYAVAELTVAGVIFDPVVLGERRDLGGVIVTPAIGLLTRFP